MYGSFAKWKQEAQDRNDGDALNAPGETDGFQREPSLRLDWPAADRKSWDALGAYAPDANDMDFTPPSDLVATLAGTIGGDDPAAPGPMQSDQAQSDQVQSQQAQFEQAQQRAGASSAALHRHRAEPSVYLPHAQPAHDLVLPKTLTTTHRPRMTEERKGWMTSAGGALIEFASPSFVIVTFAAIAIGIVLNSGMAKSLPEPPVGGAQSADAGQLALAQPQTLRLAEGQGATPIAPVAKASDIRFEFGAQGVPAVVALSFAAHAAFEQVGSGGVAPQQFANALTPVIADTASAVAATSASRFAFGVSEAQFHIGAARAAAATASSSQQRHQPSTRVVTVRPVSVTRERAPAATTAARAPEHVPARTEGGVATAKTGEAPTALQRSETPTRKRAAIAKPDPALAVKPVKPKTRSRATAQRRKPKPASIRRSKRSALGRTNPTSSSPVQRRQKAAPSPASQSLPAWGHAAFATTR